MPHTTKKTPDAWKRVVSFGAVKCAVRCFPSNGEGTLSLANYYDADGRKEDPTQEARISARLAGIKVTDAFAPSVASMSALIANPRELTDVVCLSRNVRLLRKKGLSADGIPLLPNQTAVASLGGCRWAIAVGGSYLLAVHIGADSLVDRKRIEAVARGKADVPTRKYESVIFAIAEFFSQKGVALSKVFIQCLYGLEAYTHDLQDPVYKHYNAALAHDIVEKWQLFTDKKLVAAVDGTRVNFNLFHLLKAQAISVGMTGTNIRDDLLLPIRGFFGNTRHPDERLNKESNLVTATRIS